MHAAKTVDSLLAVVEIGDASGQVLYNGEKKLLGERNIPVANIIGVASDNCSTMTESKSGFQMNLKQDVLFVFVLGCICHSFALCANYACNRLPSWLETFVRNVCYYFSRSSKRQQTFSHLQKACRRQVKHKMLKLSQTRWQRWTK